MKSFIMNQHMAAVQSPAAFLGITADIVLTISSSILALNFVSIVELSFTSIPLRHVCILQVLDEADRMLDMGFEPEVRAILSQTSSGQSLSHVCLYVWAGRARNCRVCSIIAIVSINVVTIMFLVQVMDNCILVRKSSRSKYKLTISCKVGHA